MTSAGYLMQGIIFYQRVNDIYNRWFCQSSIQVQLWKEQPNSQVSRDLSGSPKGCFRFLDHISLFSFLILQHQRLLAKETEDLNSRCDSDGYWKIKILEWSMVRLRSFKVHVGRKRMV